MWAFTMQGQSNQNAVKLHYSVFGVQPIARNKCQDILTSEDSILSAVLN